MIVYPVGAEDQPACRDLNPDWWHPDAGASSRRARAICRTCPVQQRCLDYALTHRPIVRGIWGGTTTTERRDIRTRRAA